MSEKIHDLAKLFPLMEGQAYEDLKADIKAHGLLHPIVKHEGVILDGRNRLRACEEVGRPPHYEEFASLKLSCTPEEYIWASNAERRHLTDGQKAAIATQFNKPQIATEAHARKVQSGKATGRGKKKVLTDRSKPLSTRKQLAQMAGVSERQMQNAEYVEKYAPELGDKVISGEMELSAAMKEAKKRAAKVSSPKIVAEPNVISQAELSALVDEATELKKAKEALWSKVKALKLRLEAGATVQPGRYRAIEQLCAGVEMGFEIVDRSYRPRIGWSFRELGTKRRAEKPGKA